ncbi:MAG: FG-GAP-like repeat-containing protein [Patescibacteria group bacterium]|nr:FG-GAP-like repeat-containing protein [Patescibacteria group bacterium]
MKRVLFSLVFIIGGVFFIIYGASAAYGDTTGYLGKLYDGDGQVPTTAYLDFPEDVTVDSSGNFYIADTYNNVIRKISNNIITTFAGTGSSGSNNGGADSAEFNLPRGVTIDNEGSLYVADSGNNQIRKIDRYGAVSTLVSTDLNNPQGVLFYNNRIYIADTDNNALKTVAINGEGLQILTNDLNKPKKITIDSGGQNIYVADSGSHKVKRVYLITGQVSEIAGSGEEAYAEGIGSAASFQNIWGVAHYDGKLYVTDGDGYDDKLRMIDLANNQTTLLARDQVMASLNFPSGLMVHEGNVFVANMGIGTIRKFDLSDPDDINSDFAGSERFGNRNGEASQALLGRPWDMVLSPDRQWLYLAENNKIRKINYATKEVYQLIGSSVDNYREGSSTNARFSNISSITIDSSGNYIYLTDRWNNRIRRINLSDASSSLLAGGGLINTTGSQNNGYSEGIGEAARFNNPGGIVISPDDRYLYVSDSGNNRIRRVEIATGLTELVAGSGQAGFLDGTGDGAMFNKPYGLDIDSTGRYLYVADTNNHTIRRIDLVGNQVTTIAGTGSAGYRDAVGTLSVFSYPEYLTLDPAGNIYVTEVGSHRIRLIEAGTYVTKLIAGSGNRGYQNGARTMARFNNIKGLLVDRTNNILLVADSYNDMLRQVDILGAAPYADPAPTVSAVDPNKVAASWDKGNGLRIKIVGKNFRHGAETYFATIKSSKTYVVSSTELVVELPLTKMTPGWYDVVVSNSDGQSAILTTGFGLMDSSGQVPNITHVVERPGSFYAYASNLRGGYYIAVGNVLGDNKEEIITGTGQGLGPQVRVFDNAGKVKSQFFAYAATLRSGVRLASCDLDGNGSDEIVTIPGPGGRPHVRIFDGYGNVISKGFFALDGKFKGGANVACGDIDGDGKGEIMVAAGPGGGPHVTIHRSDGTLIGNFMAYAKTFHGGIKIAALDLDGDGIMEMMTGPEHGGPHVQMFKGRTGKRINPGIFAFSRNFSGGLAVAGGDIDGDGIDEMLVTPGPEAESLLKIYENFGNTFIESFYLFSKAFTGASNIASGDINGDGVDEIVAIANSKGAPFVVQFTGSGASVGL